MEIEKVRTLLKSVTNPNKVTNLNKGTLHKTSYQTDK